MVVFTRWFWTLVILSVLLGVGSIAHAHVLSRDECRQVAQSAFNFSMNREKGLSKWAALQNLKKEMDEHIGSSLIRDEQDVGRIMSILDAAYSHIEGEADNKPGEMYDGILEACTKDLPPAPRWNSEVPDALVPIMPPYESMKEI